MPIPGIELFTGFASSALGGLESFAGGVGFLGGELELASSKLVPVSIELQPLLEQMCVPGVLRQQTESVEHAMGEIGVEPDTGRASLSKLETPQAGELWSAGLGQLLERRQFDLLSRRLQR